MDVPSWFLRSSGRETQEQNPGINFSVQHREMIKDAAKANFATREIARFGSNAKAPREAMRSGTDK